jgi:molybdenum-dependent DNA-binding transcriptional regulator ModE
VQPAVTQMLTQLETVLAVTLLERRRNGSFSTPLGSVLLPRVQRLSAHIQSALRDPAVGASLSGRETTKSVENKMTDTHIRSLTAITECGSFAAAARRRSTIRPLQAIKKCWGLCGIDDPTPCFGGDRLDGTHLEVW